MTRPPSFGLPLGYWGVIEHAVASRASTADLWAAIKAATADETNRLSGITFSDVNRLRSAAARIRNAGQVLNKADPEQVLHGSMIATAPWARNEESRQLDPKLQVRFLHTTEGEDGQQETWRTYMHPGPPPQTVHDLFDLVDRAGQKFAEDYEVDHVSVSDLSALIV